MEINKHIVITLCQLFRSISVICLMATFVPRPTLNSWMELKFAEYGSYYGLYIAL